MLEEKKRKKNEKVLQNVTWTMVMLEMNQETLASTLEAKILLEDVPLGIFVFFFIKMKSHQTKEKGGENRIECE